MRGPVVQPVRPQRVAIIGCAGSGKTTLAHRLSELTGLPLYHLDEIYFDRQGSPLPDNGLAAAHRWLLQRESGIIEGNHTATLDDRLAWADLIIWLDVPTARCLANVVRRYILHGAGRHPGGLIVHLQPQFLRYILQYRRHRRPLVADRVRAASANADVVVLNTIRSIDRLLAGVCLRPLTRREHQRRVAYHRTE